MTRTDPAIFGVITLTAMICMTIQPIVAFGLIPLLGMLWLVWAANKEAMAHYEYARIKAILTYAMEMNETKPNAAENNLTLTENNITAVENTIALTENNISAVDNKNNTEPSIDENNNTKEPSKDEPANDDDRSAATTPHSV